MARRSFTDESYVFRAGGSSFAALSVYLTWRLFFTQFAGIGWDEQSYTLAGLQEYMKPIVAGAFGRASTELLSGLTRRGALFGHVVGLSWLGYQLYFSTETLEIAGEMVIGEKPSPLVIVPFIAALYTAGSATPAVIGGRTH